MNGVLGRNLLTMVQVVFLAVLFWVGNKVVTTSDTVIRIDTQLSYFLEQQYKLQARINRLEMHDR